VRITYHGQADMACIQLRGIEDFRRRRTVPGWPDSTAGLGIDLDFDPDGHLIGIEVEAATPPSA
jgi:uncharacterized protein YuzE